MCDFKLPSRCRWDLHTPGILHSVKWQFLTDVSEQPTGPIFNGPLQVGSIESPEMLVNHYHYMLHNISIHLIVYLLHNDMGICCFPLYLICGMVGLSSSLVFFLNSFCCPSWLSFGQEQTRLQSVSLQISFINRVGNMDLLFNVHVQVYGGLIIMIMC